MPGLSSMNELLLGNDVAENPGPETKVGEVSVFHWNSRSIRHKLDHLLGLLVFFYVLQTKWTAHLLIMRKKFPQ
jgi:hypothetical protein